MSTENGDATTAGSGGASAARAVIPAIRFALEPGSSDNRTNPNSTPLIALDCDNFTLIQPFPLSELFDSKGQKSFRIVMKDGELIELTSIPEQAGVAHPATTVDGYVSMSDAAKHLRHGYYWLSRNWKHLGLRPKRIGRVLFFRRTDLDALIARQRPLGIGRSKKLIGIINA